MKRGRVCVCVCLFDYWFEALWCIVAWAEGEDTISIWWQLLYVVCQPIALVTLVEWEDVYAGEREGGEGGEAERE